jgi:hypothetical protein
MTAATNLYQIGTPTQNLINILLAIAFLYPSSLLIIGTTYISFGYEIFWIIIFFLLICSSFYYNEISKLPNLLMGPLKFIFRSFGFIIQPMALQAISEVIGLIIMKKDVKPVKLRIINFMFVLINFCIYI